jgi:26S proteasome regulatory subunit T6
MLREELQLLQEQGSLVGEVVKAMDKKKVLVKVNQNLGKKNIYNISF